MQLPRFSIREILMLTAIVALITPHVYQAATTKPTIDISYGTLRQIIQSVEPRAYLRLGTGDDEFAEFKYVVPSDAIPDFVEKVRAKVHKRVVASGWKVISHGISSLNGIPAKFNYTLANGNARCNVYFLLVDRKPYDDPTNQVEEIRLLLFSPQTH